MSNFLEQQKKLDAEATPRALNASVIKEGDTFNRWTVIKPYHSKSQDKWKSLCRCECGEERVVGHNPLKSGRSKSCGCFLISKITTHGLYKTREYKIWLQMIQRCENPKNIGYPRYGGRGITVSEEWHVFTNFLRDMGKSPKGRSLERIDNDLGYSKENCKWATHQEQCFNQQKNVTVEVDGEKVPVALIADKMGISRVTLLCRAKKTGSIYSGYEVPTREQLLAAKNELHKIRENSFNQGDM